MKRHSRTVGLIGESNFGKLTDASVLIVGVGGVGGYIFETLVRAGIGHITVVDGDIVDESNINRQILATLSTVGRHKAVLAAERAAIINPDCEVAAIVKRFNAETEKEIFAKRYDYVADAIDSVSDKVRLITLCNERSIDIISAMGAGNRLSCDFKVTDIYKTAYDGLVKAVRSRLKSEGIKKLKVVCSDSPAQKRDGLPASISYPPAVMGCMMGGEIIKDLISR